jgi:hypothetical protein
MKGLEHAAVALEALADGRVPEQASVLAGALALQTLSHRGVPGRDIRDAASGLETLATGGTLDLNSAGRERAGKLAEIVRGHIPKPRKAADTIAAIVKRGPVQQVSNNYQRGISDVKPSRE